MSGLSPEQLDELIFDIKELLEEPWAKGIGCPRSLTLRDAVIITCAYTRQHIIQEVLAEIFDTSQPTVSRIITKFTPLIDEAAAGDRPSAEEAAEATKGAITLVDELATPNSTAINTKQNQDRSRLSAGGSRLSNYGLPR